MQEYEVAIIGGGPGGYEAAIRLQQYGISVVCIEKARLGGVCLNQGCIPTKALVKVAELHHEMTHADEYGLEKANFNIDYSKIFQRKNAVVDKLVSGIEQIFDRRQIPIITGNVEALTKAGLSYTLATAQQPLATAQHIIIATGSSPKPLACLPFDHVNILSSEDILDMQTLPQSLAIIGGGVIGCEFACIFARFGVEVTIIEFLPEIIPTEDEEISKRLAMQLKKSSIKVLTKTAVEAGKLTEGGVELSLSSGKTITAEKVLVSVGRVPQFDIDFDLTKEKGFIAIDHLCRTSEENIFAIGDVTGKLMLAHTASKQGLLVADYLNQKLHNHPMHLNPINYANIPSCIFTSPEVASCGVRENKAEGINIQVGRFPYTANGKALASGATVGFVKTIIDTDSGVLIGMHIIGYLATELIAQASILIAQKATVADVANIVFAHPTISECVMESVEDTQKMAIHIL